MYALASPRLRFPIPLQALDAHSLVRVKIHDLSRGGSGVARLETGEIVFIPMSAPGDELLIKITERSKSYCQGEIAEILSPSPSRITPRCKYFGRCGGCDWQHLPYSLQFETKWKGLLHTLKKVQVSPEGIPFDLLPADHEYSYRNRIQLHGNAPQSQMGFYERGSKRIVDIDRCEISKEAINQNLQALKAQGFSKMGGDFKLEIETDEAGGVRSAWNQKHAAFGFRQINDEQNAKLVDWVAKHTKPADALFDLYGGIGNLSLPIANRFTRVDCVDLSIRSQPELPPHFHLIRKDMGRWGQEPWNVKDLSLSASFILDPPREGLGTFLPSVEAKISKLGVQSMILVGCDVDSFARDCSRFMKRGFKLERLGALDLFPQTAHLESLALFSK